MRTFFLRLLRPSIAGLSFGLAAPVALACPAGMSDVTSAFSRGSDLHANLEGRWKNKCPDLFCGAPDKKTIEIESICMAKVDPDNGKKFHIEGTLKAKASFGWAVPLNDTQHISATGIADFDDCEFTLLEKLGFGQSGVETLAGFFVGPEDGPISIRDAAHDDQCAHYIPPKFIAQQ